MHKLENASESPEKLTLYVLQITQMLGMFQAELARILGLNCSDIGLMAQRKRCLAPDDPAWSTALLLIRLYESLFDCFRGDEVAIHHWLRAENETLAGVPLYLIVDQGKLSLVLNALMSMEQE